MLSSRTSRFYRSYNSIQTYLTRFLQLLRPYSSLAPRDGKTRMSTGLLLRLKHGKGEIAKKDTRNTTEIVTFLILSLPSLPPFPTLSVVVSLSINITTCHPCQTKPTLQHTSWVIHRDTNHAKGKANLLAL